MNSLKIVPLLKIWLLGCKCAPATTAGRTDKYVRGVSIHWSEKVRRRGELKGQWSLIVLIHLDRGPSCKTTNDLHMRQWHGNRYIWKLQITVAASAMKPEALSQSLLPPASNTITYTKWSSYNRECVSLPFLASMKNMETWSHADNKWCACDKYNAVIVRETLEEGEDLYCPSMYLPTCLSMCDSTSRSHRLPAHLLFPFSYVHVLSPCSSATHLRL